MNNNKYILLRYKPTSYEIYIISENKKIKLSNKNAELMRKILNKYPYQQIDENTYIFHNVIKIMLTFDKERKKLKQPKKVNRQKSKKIATSIILTTSIILATSGIGVSLYYNHKETNEEGITITLPADEKEETNDIPNEIKTETEKIKVTIDSEFIEGKNPDTNIKNNHTAILNYHDETPGDQKALEIASQYNELFLKYEKRYGIDANLLKAIAAQESSGRQNTTNGYAVGLMGIENTWDNDKITAYNFETNQYEEIIVDYEKAAKDVNYCVKVRAAGFQQSFYTVIKSKLLPDDEKLSYTLQRTNMGATRMQNILASGEHWMEGRKKVDRGDKTYFENVLSRLPNGTTIKIKMPDGTYFSTIITNLSLENNYSKN